MEVNLKEKEKEGHKVLDCFINYSFFEKDKESSKFFQVTLKEMDNYFTKSFEYYSNCYNNFSSLEQKYIEKLPFKIKEREERIKKALQINQNFYSLVTSQYKTKFDKLTISEKDYKENAELQSIYIKDYFFRSLVRDWTSELQKEREINYGKILFDIKKYYNYDDKDFMKKNNIKVLIPGAGCCRMAYEMAKRGFNVEVNDIFYVVILCDDYLFNYSHKNEFSFCPGLCTLSKSLTSDIQFKQFSFPDVDIKDELIKNGAKQIIFNKGDFSQNYKGKKEEYDIIITIFFIDVYQNIIECVDDMNRLLKKGGIWINLGTFDYLYYEYNASIDLTWDELREVILKYNFEIKNEITGFIPYGVRDGSFETIENYGTVFFTAQKKNFEI